MSYHIKVLEKKLRGKLLGMKSGTVTLNDHIAEMMFNQLQDLDEALYEELLIKYLEIRNQK